MLTAAGGIEFTELVFIVFNESKMALSNNKSFDEDHTDSLRKLPDGELLGIYENLGAECESHRLDCSCQTCSLFMAVGDEIHQRRRYSNK